MEAMSTPASVIVGIGPVGMDDVVQVARAGAGVRLGTDAGDLDALRSDGSITPASSGGPLVNARGDVLGLLTTLAIPRVARHALGTTFAIPVDVAQQQVFTILRRASSE